MATNPREEIGKLGISNHTNLFSRLFHRTIAISAKELKTNKNKTIYLNKSSAIKWLNAQIDKNEQVNFKHKDMEIISKINNLATLELTHKKPCKLNNQNTNSLLPKISSFFCKVVLSLTSSSWGLLRCV